MTEFPDAVYEGEDDLGVCACGTPLVTCKCGDPVCPSCDPPTPGDHDYAEDA